MKYLEIRNKYLEGLLQCNPEFEELHENDLEEFLDSDDGSNFPLQAEEIQFPELIELIQYCKDNNLAFTIQPSIDYGLCIFFYETNS